MFNTFGTRFRVTTFGESHAAGLGAVVDGCPAGMALAESDLQPQLDRRRPGQSDLTTPRNEKDRIQFFSGVCDGVTLGTPIGLAMINEDQRPKDYQSMQQPLRPSHAEFTYQTKYGVRASSGGGRSSARETAARVAAGGIAEKVLAERFGVEIVAWVSAVGDVECVDLTGKNIPRTDVDQTLVRCPDTDSASKMEGLIREVLEEKDSIGGVVTCECRGLPAGWGEPVFGKTEALLAQAMLSIPATKGFEIGSGFAGAKQRGSQHNDLFVKKEGGHIGTLTNRNGGVIGGITNGENIVFRVAFKPVATIGIPQKTVDLNGHPAIIEGKGRHDPCVLPRAVPIVESMAALTLVDLALLHQRIN